MLNTGYTVRANSKYARDFAPSHLIRLLTFPPRVTYNRALDVKYCRVNTHC